MRYISDDGKIFNTEQECLVHENIEKKRKNEEEVARREQRKEIGTKYKELLKLIYDYAGRNGIKSEIHFMPASELMYILSE